MDAAGRWVSKLADGYSWSLNCPPFGVTEYAEMLMSIAHAPFERN